MFTVMGWACCNYLCVCLCVHTCVHACVCARMCAKETANPGATSMVKTKAVNVSHVKNQVGLHAHTRGGTTRTHEHIICYVVFCKVIDE